MSGVFTGSGPSSNVNATAADPVPLMLPRGQRVGACAEVTRCRGPLHLVTGSE